MIRRRPAAARIAAAVAAAALLAGCTGSGGTGSAPPDSPAPTVTRTITHSPDSAPLGAGPTTSASGTCRLLATRTVAADVGMRLDRVTVQRAGGQEVGCTFYALQHPTVQCPASCLASEDLPGPRQAAVQLRLTRYASAMAAHNAMVRTAEAGRNAQQVKVGGQTGLAYQIAFYAKDHGRDWACAFNVGSTLAEVRTVTTGTSFNAVAVAEHLAKALG